jgi:hypothetical protein
MISPGQRSKSLVIVEYEGTSGSRFRFGYGCDWGLDTGQDAGKLGMRCLPSLSDLGSDWEDLLSSLDTMYPCWDPFLQPFTLSFHLQGSHVFADEARLWDVFICMCSSAHDASHLSLSLVG